MAQTFDIPNLFIYKILISAKQKVEVVWQMNLSNSNWFSLKQETGQ